MKNLLIVVAILTIFACSQDCKITANSEDLEMPLTEGKHYYLCVDGVCSRPLGIFELINGEITFRDRIGGELYIIKEIN